MKRLSFIFSVAFSVSAYAQEQERLIAQCVTEEDFCRTTSAGGSASFGASTLTVCSPKQKISIYTADPSMIDFARVRRDSPDPKYWRTEAFRVVISNSGIEEEIVLPGGLSVSEPSSVGRELENRRVSFFFDRFFVKMANLKT